MAGYGMGGYVGSSEDQRRILRQEKEREAQRRQFEDEKKKLENANAGLRQFGAGTSEMLEHAFKTETVGLVTREEFVEKRQTIADRVQAEVKRQRLADEDDAWHKKEQDRAKKLKAERRQKLSFDDFEDEEEEEEEQVPIKIKGAATTSKSIDGIPDDNGNGKGVESGSGGEGSNGAAAAGTNRKYATLGKDPTVRSDFLPDKDRERQEHEMREALKKEWALKQAAIKTEPLEITYSYWNGSGHRRVLTVSKGDTIATFLKGVQEQLAPSFREIRMSSVGSLMYIKEDIILPHTVSFYDLIVNKAMGKSGPLFQFDLQEHAATVFDPRMKSQDSHAGKVVERHWYNRHKHVFPYSNWEVYDPEKHAKEAKEQN